MTPFVDLNDDTPDRILVKEFAVDDYRFHQMSDGGYLVFKDVDEEPTYEIDSQFGCNCPAATYRNKTCKHEKFAGFERGTEDTSGKTLIELVKGDDENALSSLEDLLE